MNNNFYYKDIVNGGLIVSTNLFLDNENYERITEEQYLELKEEIAKQAEADERAEKERMLKELMRELYPEEE